MQVGYMAHVCLNFSIPLHTDKAPSTQKPPRRRKPTPKVAERLKQQGAEGQQKSRGSGTTPNLSAPPLSQDSDFDSSDEDTLLPFLDSSLSEKERRPSQDSTSSWQSSNSDTNDHPINIDLASITHGHTHHSHPWCHGNSHSAHAHFSSTNQHGYGGGGCSRRGRARLGEAEPGTTGVGGASQWLSPPSASSTSSSNNSAE